MFSGSTAVGILPVAQLSYGKILKQIQVHSLPYVLQVNCEEETKWTKEETTDGRKQTQI